MQDPEELGVVLASLVGLISYGEVVLTHDVATSEPFAQLSDDTRQYVVVVTGEGSADGLVAQSLGDAVLTLPRSAALEPLVAELQRLNATRLVLLGGPDVISADVAADLTTSTTASVTRFAGQDRYATAARAAISTFLAPVPRVLVATSDASLGAESAAASPASAIPVLLVTRTSVPAVTTRALQQLRPGGLTIVGGNAVVSQAVVRQLQQHVTGQVTSAPVA